MQDVTRRWVLRVGGGVLLTGFRGVEGAEQSLPPGLYLPSLNHVMHRMHAAPARPLAGYQPRFFTTGEFSTLVRLIGAMLGDVENAPELTSDIGKWIDLVVSESPGVREAVLAFPPGLRLMTVRLRDPEYVRNLETSDPQRLCREGLRALSVRAAKDPAGALQAASAAAPADASRRFFDYLKRRVIEGYYTSPQGLRELDYKGNSFYSELPACTAAH